MSTASCFAAAGRPSLDEIRRAFSEFARQHGVIEPKGGFEFSEKTEKVKRCDVILNGRVHPGDGSYRLFPGDVPAGWVQNHCNGAGARTWCFYKALTPEQKAALAKQAEAASKQFEADQAARHKEAALKAEEQLAYAAPASGEHPYLVKRSVKPHGLSIDDDGWLLVPMRDADGVVHSLQRISPAGEKLFLSGGRKRGLFFTIGAIDPEGEIYMGEGFATMASVHEATRKSAVVAFDCGNLLPAAKALCAKYPSVKLIFCADDDAWTAGNPGRTKAEEAAKSVGGSVASPVFAEPRKMGATDFNDLAAAEGLQAVRRCIEKAAAKSFKPEWPEPQPLVSRIEPEPYPIEALPERLRAAVKEVHSFVKAPLSMVASSAIAALSTVAQALIDVRRDEELSGPVSLFLLNIAESGERKSQVDKMFTRPIQRYEDRKAEEANPLLKDDRAKMAAWESKHTGIKDRIRRAASEGKPTEGYESELYEHERKRPEPRRVPKLLREDTTPEGLAKRLQHGWPSAGVISNEAGIVFGAHGMNNESIMRNLALLNKLWDGGRYRSDRSEDGRCRDVRGARLTMGLMVQEQVLREFMRNSKGLARGSGFIARFLICWPESTMGTRFYQAPAEGMPALNAFNERLEEILECPAPVDEAGALTPAEVTLSPKAKLLWIEYHDGVERDLGQGGDLYDVKDVASKSADNAARLAALFAYFERGTIVPVEQDDFRRAAQIALWHLSEARRFLGEFSMPEDLMKAAHLENWLITQCRKKSATNISRRDIQQYGPYATRDKRALDAVLAELAELGRIREVRTGKKRDIHINPDVLGDAT